jgi:hypothetical protein
MRPPDNWYNLWDLWCQRPPAQCEQLWDVLLSEDQQRIAYRLDKLAARRPESLSRLRTMTQLFALVTPAALITALEAVVERGQIPRATANAIGEQILAGVGPDGRWR